MTNNSTVPAVILTTEEISKKFDDYKETSAKYDKYALALVIEDADKLAVASNNVAQISNALRQIEDIRKATGDPYFSTVKAINAYAGVLSAPLERLKATINGKITTYKILKEAQAKLKKEREATALAEVAEAKRKELARLTQIQNMIKAMLYGGVYNNMKNEPRSSDGCKTVQECEDLRKIVTEKFPAPASFKYCNKDAETIFSTIVGWIDAHSSSLDLLSKIPTESNSLLNSIMSAGKSSADNDVTEIKAEVTKNIEKETAKAEKKLDKEIANAKKGVRRTLQFEIVDESLVPVHYKIVDGSKITVFMSEHKEEIMAILASGNEVTEVPGIRFYVHDQNIGK